MKALFRGGVLSAVLMLAACGGDGWLDHHGSKLKSQDLDDRWVVVNYWAEWCAPCLEELPEFNNLAREHPEVVVLGVNYDGIAGDELRELAEKMDIRFSVMGQDFVTSLGLETPQVLPTTYILNPAGEVVHSLAGPQTEATLLGLLQ